MFTIFVYVSTVLTIQGQGYDPHTFGEELEGIDELQKSLEKIEQVLRKATSKQDSIN